MGIINITFECGEPQQSMAARFVTIKLGDSTIYEELVYDTNAKSERTEEQAVKNAIFLCAGKLRSILEDKSD